MNTTSFYNTISKMLPFLKARILSEIVFVRNTASVGKTVWANSIMKIKNIFTKSNWCCWKYYHYSPTDKWSTWCVEPETWQTLWLTNISSQLETWTHKWASRLPVIMARESDTTWCIMYERQTVCSQLRTEQCWWVSTEIRKKTGVSALPGVRLTFRLHVDSQTISTPGFHWGKKRSWS